MDKYKVWQSSVEVSRVAVLFVVDIAAISVGVFGGLWLFNKFF